MKTREQIRKRKELIDKLKYRAKNGDIKALYRLENECIGDDGLAMSADNLSWQEENSGEPPSYNQTFA